MSDKIIKINSRTTAYISVLFTNTRILKFKSQETFPFFSAANHLSGPLRKQSYLQGVQKVMVCDFDWWTLICEFLCFTVLCFDGNDD